MGKGDRKSKKGKLWRGSFGNSRNREAIRARVNKGNAPQKTEKKEAVAETKPKKTARKKSAK